MSDDLVGNDLSNEALDLLQGEQAELGDAPPSMDATLWRAIEATQASPAAVAAVLSRVDQPVGALQALAAKALTAKVLPMVIVAAGLVGGSVWMHQSTVSAPNPVTVQPAVIEMSPDSVVESPPVVPAPQKVRAKVVRPVAVAPSAAVPEVEELAPPAPSPEDTLSEESHLLELARAALSEGRATPARVALKAHASRFPDGVLSEERDALLVRVLLNEGDLKSARASTAAFANRYPHSVFLAPLVDGLRKARTIP